MRRKLPFWSTVGMAFRLTVRHLPLLMRLSWLWLLVMAPILFIFEYAAASYGVTSDLSYLMISFLVPVPMASSIAVAWHRKLLLDEDPPRGIYLRFDRIVFVYAAIATVIFALSFLGFWLTPIALMTVDDQDVAEFMFGRIAAIVVGGLIGLYLGTRLWMTLPHFALGRETAQRSDGWVASRGNVARLLFGSFITCLPGTALMIGAALPFAMAAFGWPEGSPLASAIFNTLFALFGVIVFAMPTLTFLSLAYRRLVQETAQTA